MTLPTTPHRRWTRPAAALLTALSLTVGLAGCARSKPAATPSPPGRIGAELALLRSPQNGLYYPPFLRLEPAGPEDNSYALTIRELLGEHPEQSLSDERIAFFRSESLSASPVAGRAWLVAFRRAGAGAVLGPADATAVRALRAAGGWYTDPSSPDPATRAEITAHAVAVLAALNAVTAADRAASGPWLSAQLTSPSVPVRAWAADALSALGLPVPATAAAVVAPDASQFPRLTGDQRQQLLLDTDAYVRLRTDAHLGVTVDTASWAQVLDHSVGALGMRELSMLVSILRAGGRPAADFGAVRSRLQADLLDDGSIRDPSAYSGNPEASFQVLALRSWAGESTRDAELATALNSPDVVAATGQDASTRLAVSAGRSLATGGPAADAVALCRTPPKVTEQTVGAWIRFATLCAALHRPVSAPAVTAWPVRTPQAVVAAARLSNTLADNGLGAPAWIGAGAFRPYLTRSDDVGGVGNYAELLRAYTRLGGVLTAAQLAAADRIFTAAHGCPGLADLYRIGGGDKGCDLATTWSVWKLGRQLNHRYGP